MKMQGLQGLKRHFPKSHLAYGTSWTLWEMAKETLQTLQSNQSNHCKSLHKRHLWTFSVSRQITGQTLQQQAAHIYIASMAFFAATCAFARARARHTPGNPHCPGPAVWRESHISYCIKLAFETGAATGRTRTCSSENESANMSRIGPPCRLPPPALFASKATPGSALAICASAILAARMTAFAANSLGHIEAGTLSAPD